MATAIPFSRMKHESIVGLYNRIVSTDLPCDVANDLKLQCLQQIRTGIQESKLGSSKTPALRVFSIQHNRFEDKVSAVYEALKDQPRNSLSKDLRSFVDAMKYTRKQQQFVANEVRVTISPSFQNGGRVATASPAPSEQASPQNLCIAAVASVAIFVFFYLFTVHSGSQE